MTIYLKLDNMTKEEADKAIAELVTVDKTQPGWQAGLIERHKQWGLDFKVLNQAEVEKLVKRIERGGTG